MSTNTLWARKGSEQDGYPRLGSLASPNLQAIAEYEPDSMSVVVSFGTYPRRVQGKYRLRTATATLDYRNMERPDYRLEIHFKKVEDGQELYELIRAGKTWPKPSFEDEQVPSPLRHLKDLWPEVWGIIRREVSARYHRLATS